MSKVEKVLGIIFPNMHDEAVSELTELRTMASVPFGGRYRLIDFTLSEMVAAGVDNVALVVKRNYLSLMDHIGAGKEYDLARKKGGLKIFPPYSEHGTTRYTGKLEALSTVLGFIEDAEADTVILADSGVISTIDYKDVFAKHAETGADITAIYKTETIEDAENVVFDLDENKKVKAVYINEEKGKKACSSVYAYVIGKELLIKLVKEGVKRGKTNFEKDVLQANADKLAVYGYEYTGYLSRITSLKTYFDANIALTEKGKVKELFSQHPVYTKIRDDAPVMYLDGSVIKTSVIADGCYIEGFVDSSVLFRGVKVAKDAVITNCVLMQDTVIEEGVILENVICDKEVVITKGKHLKGDANHPVYISKREKI